MTVNAVILRHHWREIWPTNTLKRANKEIEQRTNIGGVFFNDDGVLTLVRRILAEQHEQ